MQIAQSNEMNFEIDLNLKNFGENLFKEKLASNFISFLSNKRNNFEQGFLKRSLFFCL